MLKTREEIEEWLTRCSEVCGFREYTINEDLTVDVNGTVNLDDAGLEEIPLQFGFVSESFYCNNNKLTSLKGSPRSVGHNFLCERNQLTSLNYGPEIVGANFYCANNQLTSLDGAPKIIGTERCPPYHEKGNFICSKNPLNRLGSIDTQLDGGMFIFTGACNYNPSYLPELESFQHFEKDMDEKIPSGIFNSVVRKLKVVREEKELLESSVAKLTNSSPIGSSPIAKAHEIKKTTIAPKRKFKL